LTLKTLAPTAIIQTLTGTFIDFSGEDMFNKAIDVSVGNGTQLPFVPRQKQQQMFGFLELKIWGQPEIIPTWTGW